MSKTRAELINQVLNRLQILVQGQAPAAEDVQKVDVLVDPALAKLAALDIYYVQDGGEIGPTGGDIQDEAFLSVADYVASNHLLADARMQALAMQAEKDLRTIAAPPRTLKFLRIDPALWPRRISHYRGGF